MQLALIFWGSFVLAISGAVMPGPVLTATISEVTRRGFIAGPLIIVGHGIVEVTLLLALFMGLAAWLTQDVVLGWLGLVGGVVLIGMGTDMIRTARASVAVEPAANPSPTGGPGIHGPVLSGMGTTLSNPYWYGWWATVGLSFAAQSLRHGIPGISSFFIGHISADFLWYGLVAAAIAGGRRLLSPVRYRIITSLCGVILIAMGAVFIALGWPRVG
jgi:threonine/homoserine/homoserine lactone efflux protein